jgi:hypothetical protein
MSFGVFALSLPQPRQTHHRTQFEGLCFLFAGNFNGFEKTRFRFRLRLDARC